MKLKQWFMSWSAFELKDCKKCKCFSFPAEIYNSCLHVPMWKGRSSARIIRCWHWRSKNGVFKCTYWCVPLHRAEGWLLKRTASERGAVCSWEFASHAGNWLQCHSGSQCLQQDQVVALNVLPKCLSTNIQLTIIALKKLGFQGTWIWLLLLEKHN